MRLTRLDVAPIPGEERRDTRRRVALARLLPSAEDERRTRRLVARLADERLVVTSINDSSGETEVEVTHEALIRQWDRLGAWLESEREMLRLRSDIVMLGSGHCS